MKSFSPSDEWLDHLIRRAVLTSRNPKRDGAELRAILKAYEKLSLSFTSPNSILEQAICDSRDSLGAIRVRVIEEIANQAKLLLDMAESKMRVAIRDLPEPSVNHPSKELSREIRIAHSKSYGDRLDDRVVAQSENLVCCALSEVWSELEADIVDGPMGSVEIHWRNLPFQSRWVVSRSRIPWPGVNVRVVFSEIDGQIEHRLFWTAQTLMDHFRLLLEKHS